MRSRSADVRSCNIERVRPSTASRYSKSTPARSGRMVARLLGTMAVAGVRRIRVESELISPNTRHPQLVSAKQFGDVVVLNAGEVPDQPGANSAWRRRFGEPVEVDTIHGAASQRWDATVELEE
jgi:hypothetical protein